MIGVCADLARPGLAAMVWFLAGLRAESGIDMARKEEYLSDEHFEQVLSWGCVGLMVGSYSDK